MSLCQECGYELPKNGPCRTCVRMKSWQKSKYRTAESLFTKRIAKNLQYLDMQLNDKHIENIFSGQGLFLSGAAGTGKTIYACALALEVRRLGHVFPDAYKTMSVKFINVLNLLEEIRSSFNQPKDDENRITTQGILDHYSTVDILILDDLGVEYPTNWSVQTMQLILNNRYESLLSNIITSNLDLNSISRQLDDRLASRIYEMCLPVSFGEEDHRLKRR